MSIFTNTEVQLWDPSLLSKSIFRYFSPIQVFLPQLTYDVDDISSLSFLQPIFSSFVTLLLVSTLMHLFEEREKCRIKIMEGGYQINEQYAQRFLSKNKMDAGTQTLLSREENYSSPYSDLYFLLILILYFLLLLLLLVHIQ